MTQAIDPLAGLIPQEVGRQRFHRKVIRIRAEDSPNVRYGLAMERAGLLPDDEVLVPGVLTYAEYKKRRKLWDKVRQCVALDAQFWLGSALLLYPPDWLNESHRIADTLRGVKRTALGMGVDPAEGGDKTAWSIVDSLGLIFQQSMKTPDTSIIPLETRRLMDQYDIPPERVCFDRGGGGTQHANFMRRYWKIKVRTVGFGETLSLDPKRGLTTIEVRMDTKEHGYAYKNRRAQMYGELSDMLSPFRINLAGEHVRPFAIPAEYMELRRQLAPIPRWTDEEGRLFLPPKKRKPTDKEDADKITLDGLIGCSPDEADSLVLAIYAMLHKAPISRAGAVGGLGGGIPTVS